ncbi:MAG: uncharacterized protein K0S11_436 [Gammaproteobacteria bacterium]|jgi:uncharacterized PurR-regulated membrane protein YhhQ (DUF165 family)|nr:uncharacterized protein [Gammaproteobacteria bacterium]
MKNYGYTTAYMLAIVMVNYLFAYVPTFTVFGEIMTPVDIIVGCVYVLRDMAQREIKQYVIFAMLIATGISYAMADKSIAFASAAAFFVGELIDWAIYSYTKKPLSQRLLWSSAISAPIDSIVFLYLIHQLNWLGFTLLNCSKLIGILLIWYFSMRHHQKLAKVTAVIS